MVGGTFIKRTSFIGELDGAARAVDQPGAEARFELRDRPADTGLRHAHALGRFAEAARIGNSSEDYKAVPQPAVDSIHA